MKEHLDTADVNVSYKNVHLSKTVSRVATFHGHVSKPVSRVATSLNLSSKCIMVHHGNFFPLVEPLDKEIMYHILMARIL